MNTLSMIYVRDTFNWARQIQKRLFVSSLQVVSGVACLSLLCHIMQNEPLVAFELSNSK